MLKKLRQWARAIRRNAVALYFAARDPRVPWHVKALAIAIAAYALSPIDLIPDFIPVIGLLDEAILLPLAMAGIMRRILKPFISSPRQAVQPLSKTRSRRGQCFCIPPCSKI